MRGSVRGSPRSQVASLVALALALVGVVTWSAVAGSAPPVRQPQVFTASLVLADDRPLTVVDVATAEVTVQLPGVYANVGAASYGDVQPVVADGGTYLVNRATGAFNLLGADDYVVDARGPGVALAPLAGATAAAGLADGAALFVVRTAPASTVTLVDRATVEAGASGGRDAPAAGTAALDGQASGEPGAAVVAGHALWLLVAPAGGGCRLEEVRAPAPGASLRVATRATFSAACATVSLGAVGLRGGAPAGGSVPVVGVASAGLVQLVSLDGSSPGQQVHALDDASALEPVTGMPGAAAWLATTPTGQVLVRAATSGPVAVVGVGGLAPTAVPAPPAWSAGGLFTVDRAAADPTVLRIDPVSGAVVPGAPYPVVGGETATFGGATVTAVGSRVVVNNPGSLLAALVFTDGRRPGVTVDKRTALNVSASGPGVPNLGGQAPTTSVPAAPGDPAPAKPLAPVAAAPAPVDVAASCSTTAVRPYAPTVTSVLPSTTGALISWGYRLLDEHDCVPQTWSVQLTQIGGLPSPAVPEQYVDGQQQLQVGRLRPATSYSAVVTAHLPHASTASVSVTFMTSALGPDATPSVTTVADGLGHWIVSWATCDPARCLVPAASWHVTATACGGSYVGTPPSVVVPGDVGSAVIDAVGQGLLGTSVSFSVTGATETGLLGPATADGSCTQAWQPPDPSSLSLAAAARPDGSTLTATLTVTLGGDAAAAVGGSDPQFLYSVGGRTVGPTASTSVTVDGLAPGATYVPQVTVWSAGHRPAGVVVTGRSFSQTVAWPSLTLTASGAPSPADPNQGSLTATVGGLASGTYRATGGLTCGSNRLAVSELLAASAQGQELDLRTIDLTSIGGRCTLAVRITDLDDPNPYGTDSPTLSAAVQLGSRPAYAFSASYTSSCTVNCGLAVRFEGNGEPAAGGVDWVVTATVPGGSCVRGATTSVSSAAPQFPVSLPAPECSNLNGLVVTVTFRYLGASVPVISVTPESPPATTTTTTTTTSTTTTRPTKPTTPTTPTTSPTPSSTTSTSPAPSQPTTTAAPTSPHPSPPGGAQLVASRRWSGGPVVATLGAVGLGAVLVAPRRRRRRTR